ncbi:16S rRNA (guanine(966)-N(2))-methyltransferase RsmD [Pseudactinotalea sp. HY160]|uniref:16S rRNA (guanine(966)-N(2))-methyltransferase RsmD n=1 Tax=Pseudactinotalea sp. HY160 TaxID=2654490 RepID=UPI00128E2715|nr:16S rRNA (guanine(966)-N(2))-methyltransferase RsmD [Pseudactinotalea sp. HY160]MPV51214.1 16S rRNA (guanine(966)-N(2))-methyltransferase RsmD [Pseudactinotalea sp. HY160]
MTRIIAGDAGGQRLEVPAHGTRPTSDRVREAIFSRLEHVDAISRARVLDLYAGSGALGLEALSRGAESVVFVEANRAAAEVIRRNVARLGYGGRARVVHTSVASFLAGTAGEPFHTVLGDPPYDLDEAPAVLTALEPWLGPESVVLWEQSGRARPPAWPDGFVDLGARRYGETTVHLAEVPG